MSIDCLALTVPFFFEFLFNIKEIPSGIEAALLQFAISLILFSKLECGFEIHNMNTTKVHFNSKPCPIVLFSRAGIV